MTPSIQKIIKNKILENYIEYQFLFVEFQSKFLSGLHTRYQGIENGNLTLYFAKQVHQDILRKKDYDFNFNISKKNFWENHYETNPIQKSITKIAEDTLLPKETTRRKILQLMKQKILNKKNRNIMWMPNEQYKQSYNLVIKEEIEGVAKLISFVCQKLNYSISNEAVMKDLEEKFSFYWFHYLGAQLKYLKLWTKQINDIELVLILLQVSHLSIKKLKNKKLSHENVFTDSSLHKDFISASISATSISQVSNIPRATCVRKLQTLLKLKILAQDKSSKRYYMIPKAISESFISQKITKNIVEIFSDFFFICIRAMNVKT